MHGNDTGPEGDEYLGFAGLHDGVKDCVEVPGNTDDFSAVHANGSVHGLTVAAWMKPDTLIFATTEDTDGLHPDKRYVYWLGKGAGTGASGQQEWAFRMYSADNTADRANRISFYLFNLAGGLGVGSHFQEPIDAPREWIHVVGVVDTVNQITRIYKNGTLKHVDNYNGTDGPLYQGVFETLRVQTQTALDPDTGQQVPVVISPQRGNTPLRMGTRDLVSLWQGGLQGVRIWNRPLTTPEVAGLVAGLIPADNLVAQYPLNANTDTAAVDTTGAHSGTIYGATWRTPA